MVKTRVLVVEDDMHLLSGIRDILELEKYNVLTAQNGQDGLTVLKADPNNPPDVIVSDIMMPHMDGFEFLEKVREEDSWVNVPFIFLTALGESVDKRKGATMGADRYLTKPFDAEDLLNTVSTSLGRSIAINRVHEEDKAAQKDKILTILNHEMRTPLTLVVAYAEMLKDFETTEAEDDEINIFLKGVNSGADRLRRLIESFIYVVELNTGEAEKTIGFRNQPVENFGQLVEDAKLPIEQPNLRPRNFVLDIASDLPQITCDSQYITAVIRELLDNAAKFSKDGDTINLKASCEDDYLVVCVSDSGRGIPEHELEKIWKPFYQIDREQYEDQGSGSGLTIVKGMVELHGGDCDVRSTIGEGSTFTIRLPLEREKAVAT